MALARARVLELVGLALAIAFVMGVAYLPHADSARNARGDEPAWARFLELYVDLARGEADAYNYTVHVDENAHWARVASIQRAESLRADGIYDVVPEKGSVLDLRGLVHERGFHIALVHLQTLTGIEWVTLFHALPAMWAGLAAFLMWSALRPWRGALVAATLVGLVPTSARFLGPGFLVPIGFGLAWIAAALVLLPNTRRVRGASTLLVLLTLWAFFIHLIAGFAVLIVLLVSIPLQGKNFRSFALLALTASLPLVILVNFFEEGIDFELRRIGTLPIDFTIFDQLGIPFLVLWAIGCALVLTRRADHLPVAMVLRASALASMIAIAFILAAVTSRTLHYAIYDRWHQPFALLAAAPAAAGLVFLGELALRALALARPLAAGAASALLTAALVLATTLATAPALAAHLDEPYYHVIDDEDWIAFEWAAANVGDAYDVFLADPWKAPIFHALTGKTPHAFLQPGNPAVNGADWSAYQRGDGQNAVWLAERDITLVFDEANEPAGFERTSPYTVQMPEAKALLLARATAAQP